MQVQPYLNFDGRCEEAIEFYKKSLGAKVDMMMRMNENPEPQPGMSPPGTENKILHSAFHIGDTQVMASDGRMQGKPAFQGISLSLDLKTKSDAERTFRALSEGGQVQQPLIETFFSPAFGMVADRFGVSWMVIVAR